MSDWLRRMESVLGSMAGGDAGSRWTTPLRYYIATGQLEFHREACRSCSNDRLRGLLTALEEPSSASLAGGEAQVQEWLARGRREEAGALRLFMALPAAKALATVGPSAPDPERTLQAICSAALHWARDLRFRECQAYFEHALGAHARFSGALDSAYTSLSSALSILSELAGVQPALYGVALARVLHSCGKLHSDRGEHQAAEGAFAEALALCGEHACGRERDQAFHAGLLLDDGGLRDTLGDKAGALQQYQRAIAICEALCAQNAELIAPLLAGALYNLGELQVEFRQPELATPLFERSLALWQELAAGDPDSFGGYAQRVRARLSTLALQTPSQSAAHVRQLERLAERALSTGRDAILFEWWRELAQLVLALAARTRGWQVNLGGQWLAMLPPESPCVRLCTACRLMQAAPSEAGALAELAAFTSADAGSDCVLAATSAISLAAREWGGLSSGSAREITSALLGSVVAIAQEFETNGPRRDELPKVGTYDPDLRMEAVFIGQPARPRLGIEVSAALAYCEQLARRFGLADSRAS